MGGVRSNRLGSAMSSEFMVWLGVLSLANPCFLCAFSVLSLCFRSVFPLLSRRRRLKTRLTTSRQSSPGVTAAHLLISSLIRNAIFNITIICQLNWNCSLYIPYRRQLSPLSSSPRSPHCFSLHFSPFVCPTLTPAPNRHAHWRHSTAQALSALWFSPCCFPLCPSPLIPTLSYYLSSSCLSVFLYLALYLALCLSPCLSPYSPPVRACSPTISLTSQPSLP